MLGQATAAEGALGDPPLKGDVQGPGQMGIWAQVTEPDPGSLVTPKWTQ